MRDEEYRAMFDLEERLWWFRGMRSIVAALLTQDVSESARLLDVGCGTGYSLMWLRDLYGFSQEFGVDLSSRAAEFWRQRKLDMVAIASADKLPFGEDEFDLVTCFDVIYQLDGYRLARRQATHHRRCADAA